MIIEYESTISGHELLRQFEDRHGSLAKLRKRVAGRKATFRESADLEEWEHYLANPKALHGQVSVLRAGVFHDSREFFRVLTPERLRALDALRAPDARYESVHELARALGRDPKNVLQDCKALAEHGLVTLERRNARRTIPRAAVTRVVITM